jgi:hypothetical protein
MIFPDSAPHADRTEAGEIILEALKMMELLTDADHEYILAHRDHDRATEVTRKRARARGWTEEQIARHYPPCDCPGCTARRRVREMRG